METDRVLSSRTWTTTSTYIFGNIDESYPGSKELPRKSGFAMTRSLIPSANGAVNMTVEETFIKWQS